MVRYPEIMQIVKVKKRICDNKLERELQISLVTYVIYYFYIIQQTIVLGLGSTNYIARFKLLTCLKIGGAKIFL